MAMRIRYEYTEYNDYPEATEISESRSRNAVFIGWFTGLGIIASVICLIVDFFDTWPMIFLAVFCGLLLFYLFRYYDEVTEKKIRNAIDKRNKLMEEIRNPSYNCKSFKVVMERYPGKCYMCGANNVALALCDIKYKKGNSVIPVCSKCIKKFESNLN